MIEIQQINTSPVTIFNKETWTGFDGCLAEVNDERTTRLMMHVTRVFRLAPGEKPRRVTAAAIVNSLFPIIGIPDDSGVSPELVDTILAYAAKKLGVT